MNKKVVVLGGGKGISYLLAGLKDFPLDITAVISVADNGQSTGKLREELSILLDVKSKILPLTEDENITLMGEAIDGDIIEGEEMITKSPKKIKKLFYKEEPHILNEVIEAINEADLILLSMGSLYTSLFPNLLAKKVIKALDKTKAPIMYVCNIVTQPGETDNFTVSDHVNLINQYLGMHKLDVVIASNSPISQEMAEKYASEERKDPVKIDYAVLKSLDVEFIEADLLTIADNTLKHHSQKLSSLIFSYLMR